jgi:hypothetical protein
MESSDLAEKYRTVFIFGESILPLATEESANQSNELESTDNDLILALGPDFFKTGTVSKTDLIEKLMVKMKYAS